MTHRAALAVFAALLASPLPARADTLGAMAPGPLERGGVPTRLVPGRAILKLKDIDGARLELPRANDAVAIAALSDLGKRRAVELTLVRSMVLGWALVEIRDPAQRRPTRRRSRSVRAGRSRPRTRIPAGTRSRAGARART